MADRAASSSVEQQAVKGEGVAVQQVRLLEKLTAQLERMEREAVSTDNLSASLDELNASLKQHLYYEENPDVFSFRDFRDCIMKPFLCGFSGGMAAVLGKALADRLLRKKDQK